MSGKPVCTRLPGTEHGCYAVGDLVAVSDGAWSGAWPMQFTYQWYLGRAEIDGATDPTIVYPDGAGALGCLVTARNAHGAASAAVVVPAAAT